MSVSKTTTIPKTSQLAIRARRITRRVIPDLQIEIGEAPADLLLQLDHWIAIEGTNGTLTISARRISERAFPLWSVRKTQRTLRRLADLGLISVTYAQPGAAPTVALNLSQMLVLKSVTLASAPPPSPMTHPPVMGDTPTPPVTHPPVIGDAPPLPEPPSPVTHPHLIYDQKEEDDPVPLPSVGDLKETPTPDIVAELASLCQLDQTLNADRLAAHAARLAEAGYTPTDIHDLAYYWHKLDYRSRKDNGNPPFLSQVASLIKQALEHPEIQRRRALRAEGKEPDQDDELTRIYNRFTTGKYSDIVNH